MSAVFHYRIFGLWFLCFQRNEAIFFGNLEMSQSQNLLCEIAVWSGGFDRPSYCTDYVGAKRTRNSNFPDLSQRTRRWKSQLRHSLWRCTLACEFYVTCSCWLSSKPLDCGFKNLRPNCSAGPDSRRAGTHPRKVTKHFHPPLMTAGNYTQQKYYTAIIASQQTAKTRSRSVSESVEGKIWEPSKNPSYQVEIVITKADIDCWNNHFLVF